MTIGDKECAITKEWIPSVGDDGYGVYLTGKEE
jgi:hypothetical protein